MLLAAIAPITIRDAIAERYMDPAMRALNHALGRSRGRRRGVGQRALPALQHQEYDRAEQDKEE